MKAITMAGERMTHRNWILGMGAGVAGCRVWQQQRRPHAERGEREGNPHAEDSDAERCQMKSRPPDP